VLRARSREARKEARSEYLFTFYLRGTSTLRTGTLEVFFFFNHVALKEGVYVLLKANTIYVSGSFLPNIRIIKDPPDRSIALSL
jgi:hypothetical protein